jgi:pimeloyl-ACP methyl ester carboxylesterase
MPLTENKIKVENLEWFYREMKPDQGNDQAPVLLLHGIPSQSYCWCELMADLGKKGFRAIAPDWIGFGFSAKPDRREFYYTPDAYIEALGDFITNLNIEKFSLVVQGFLASVGLQYALRFPDQIEKLVILNTPLSSEVKLPWAMKQWAIPFVGDLLTQDPLLVDRTLEGGSGFVISEANLGIYRKPFLTTSAAGRALIAVIKNLQLAESMVEIETGLVNWEKPSLVIWGSQDPWLSVEVAQRLANACGKIELTVLEEAKHYPQEHWNKEIEAVLINFLRRQL